MARNYKPNIEGETNPLIDLQALTHLKTGLEAGFGVALKDLKDMFNPADGESLFERIEQIEKILKDNPELTDLTARFVALETEVNNAVDLLEQYIGGDDEYLKRVEREYIKGE